MHMDLLHQITRVPFVLGLWARLGVGSLDKRVRYGLDPYPQYVYGVYFAAVLASRLGVPEITAVELGVAGGRGLQYNTPVTPTEGQQLPL